MEKQIDWLDEKLSDNSIFEIERERESSWLRLRRA